MPKFSLSILALALFAPVVAAQDAHDHMTHEVPFYEGIGSLHHPITTASTVAQRYFDQGLTLAYAFNHMEAEMSFREAARLDPDCAMCYWGIAFVLGPNINAPMGPEAVSPAYEAVQKARELYENVTPRERAYIDALALRYGPEVLDDRSALDRAYAEAMGDVARQYPDDLDAAVLYAEALMDTMPWDYWMEDGSPREATVRVLEALESVMERAPDHAGANHFYIHAVEKTRPEQGVAAADRLGSLVPAAGHLVHMPGHIYIRVGRYADAVGANERAIVVDDSSPLKHQHGIYQLAYMPHNHHFLWASASLAGNSTKAIAAAGELMKRIDPELMGQPGLEFLQHFYVTPMFALARFGKWDDILTFPEQELAYPRAVLHYVRGVALARTGKVEEAEAQRSLLVELVDDPAVEPVVVSGLNPAATLLRIASDVLAAEIASAKGDYKEAAARLRGAIGVQDDLTYDEPPPWYLPGRQLLGAVLLKDGKAAEAEAVYLEDLREFPENGWSLFGLEEALRAQGKNDEAATVHARFQEAWEDADVKLTASVL